MSRIIKWIFLPLSALIFYFVTNAQPGGESIAIKEFKKELKKQDNSSFLILDVRTPEEFAQGSVSDALNIDWYAKDFKERAQLLSKDQKVYVYCRSGMRSAKAVKSLRSIGFNHVINVEGGYKAWVQLKKNLTF